MIDMSRAASATVRAIGPVVSWRCVMGPTPTPLTSPTVGFNPTRPLSDAGARIEPSVSEPIAAAHRLAAAPAAGPALEPDGLRVGSYGQRACPPTALQPLTERLERKFAHSLRLALPSTIAPAARSRAATGASCAWRALASASDPAVVGSGSRVSMLSLRSSG